MSINAYEKQLYKALQIQRELLADVLTELNSKQVHLLPKMLKRIRLDCNKTDEVSRKFKAKL